MSLRLLDVNVLVSLMDSAHIHHEASVAWFRNVAVSEGWATCPITENGFIRIVSNPGYPNLGLTPSLAAESLAKFKQAFADNHHLFPDDVSLTDPAVFDLKVLAGHRQTTDLYLAGLAFSKGARLVTLDAAIPWRAVRGAKASLVDRIPA